MTKSIISSIAILVLIYFMIQPPFWLDIISKYTGFGISQLILVLIVKKRLKNYLSHLAPLFLFSILISGSIKAQPYLDGHKRYSFAQTVVGLDFQYIPKGGVQSSFLNTNQQIQSYESNAMLSPRFTISGLHFWGHAEFYVTIPFGNILDNTVDDLTYNFTTNTETGFKVYPWRIEAKRIRPYLGLSFGLVSFRQSDSDNGTGPFDNKSRTPIHAGFTYNHKNQLFEIGLSYFARNKRNYPISRIDFSTYRAAPLTFNIAYKWYFDTSISTTPYEDYFNRKTKAMAAEKLLNGVSIGIAPSAVFFLGNSKYNKETRPYLGRYSAGGIFMEYSLGYYFFKPDIHLNLNYRGMRAGLNAYDTNQQLKRKSIGLEAFKFIGDYHGFVPFVGPVVSYEFLKVQETDLGDQILDEKERKFSAGVVFGWDIRPHRLQSIVLRTNLRYSPKLKLEKGDGISFDFKSLEFNFIQIVYYPGVAKRMRNFKLK